MMNGSSKVFEPALKPAIAVIDVRHSGVQKTRFATIFRRTAQPVDDLWNLFGTSVDQQQQQQRHDEPRR